MLDLCAYNQKPWNEISGGFLRKKFGYEPVSTAGSTPEVRRKSLLAAENHAEG